MLQSGNWLINVLGAGDGTLFTFFTLSAGDVKPTGVPFSLEGALAFALTFRPPPETDFDLIPPKLGAPSLADFAVDSADGEAAGKNYYTLRVQSVCGRLKIKSKK
ncbi:hypothetical protein HS088_TW23G00718 [Tripterygium wilfordii]|uniref:Uncharacterized protein n=1 Tax=Tripterygium wilfordii TaxID=458696 RepID=A0A7J7BVT3_TRIWF|nr:hypothetical protein HS088_TW23G00718 [Tripterygium wilfordii]